MGHTLLSLLGFFLLNSLNRGQAQDAVLTIEPKWTTFFTGESVTFKCDITGEKDRDWSYAIYRDGGEFLPYYKHENYKLQPLYTGDSGEYQCYFNHMGSTKKSNKVFLTVSERPQPVLTVSPSWLSPGASVTLNCRVDHPSAGWRFYWYKAAPRLSDSSYSYELLAGSASGTEQDLYIVDGQTHTAGYVCRAGRGDPVFYSLHSSAAFLWSGDINSAASLTVSPESVQHFTQTSVSLSCDGNSTEWRVMRFSKFGFLLDCSIWGTMTGSTCKMTRDWISGVYWCESETGQFSNAVNISTQYGDLMLVSPVRPVAEGRSVTLSCEFKTEPVYNVDFYKNDKLIQNDTRREMTIPAVSKSDEGFYKCKRRDSVYGSTSQSWLSVKSASQPGKDSQFPILLIVGLLCGVLLIIFLLLFLYLYRKSKGSCHISSQRTNQSPATDHMINQDENHLRECASVLQDNTVLYETIKGPEEPANDESTDVTYSVVELKKISKKGKKEEPEDCVYSCVQKASAAAGKSSRAPAEETVYSEVKPGTAVSKNAA
ncbi:Fc receptor-like protein 4 [Eleginops maclovinus]|uniref:Fc receptor-like protein 4 n=1 Tax=Eleginops maclovinus TaxID=56733 RepID=UPI00308068E2